MYIYLGSSWLINPFIIMKWPYLSLITFVGLIHTSSCRNIAILAFLWSVLHGVSFSIILPLTDYLWISSSCILLLYLIWKKNLCLYLVFVPLYFYVLIDMVGVKSTNLLGVFHLFHLFLLCCSLSLVFVLFLD